MAYDSSGKWQFEDDGVASRVAAITAGGSPLMTQARTSGMQAANRRGLGNSSMAAGAAEQAVIAAATPIASQDAQQTAQKNVLEMQNRQQIGLATMEDSRIRDLSAADITSRKDLATMEDLRVRELQAQQFKQQMGLATMEDTRARDLSAADLASRSQLAAMEDARSRALATMEDTRSRDLSAADLASRQSLAAMEDARSRALATQQIDANRGLATMEDTRARDLAAMNVAAQREQQLADIGFKTGLAGQEDARIRELQAQQIQADAEKTTRTLAAEQQRQIAASLSDMSSQRFAATSNLLQNEKIPADVRAAAQASINAQYDSTLNYFSNLYGVKLSNATPTAAPATAVPAYAGYGQ